MSRRWLARLAIVTGAATALLGFSTAAWADTSAEFNQQLPKTASDFANTCASNQGGGPFAGKEVWVFNLPSNDRDFVSVTATFSGAGTITIENSEAGPDADGDDISVIPSPGTSKAWAVLNAGQTLTAASAIVTGNPPTGNDKLKFVVTHVCRAGGVPSPDDSPDDTPSPDDSGSESESDSPGPSDSTPGTGTSTTPGDLPETGVGLTGLILTGFALTIAGAALLFFRRKRDGDDLAGETPAT